MSKFLLYDDDGYREMTDADWFDYLRCEAEICRAEESPIEETIEEAQVATGEKRQKLLVGLTVVIQNVIYHHTRFLSVAREMMSEATAPDEVAGNDSPTCASPTESE